MASKVEPLLIKAAISLFGEFGYEGVTTRALAGKAEVQEWNIYRLFGDKEGLYQRAITSVVQSSVDAMAEFALNFISGGSGKDMGQAALITAVVHHWYSSLSTSGARLIFHVRVGDKKRRTEAELPLGKIIGILEKTIEPESRKTQKGKFDARTRAELLVRALFDLKTTYSGKQEKETDEVNRVLQDWLKTLPSSK
jgi:AcrR family transcriptional regulator